MKKMMLMLAMYKAFSTNRFFVMAKISRKINEAQIEIHPVANIKEQMDFYSEKYDGNLECKLSSGTKIVAYADGADMIEAVKNISEKLRGEEC